MDRGQHFEAAAVHRDKYKSERRHLNNILTIVAGNVDDGPLSPAVEDIIHRRVGDLVDQNSAVDGHLHAGLALRDYCCRTKPCTVSAS